jgi:hypothetical protein
MSIGMALVALPWHIVTVSGPSEDDGLSFRLELQLGEQVAYVDVAAWEDRYGDAHLEVLGEWPLGDAFGREAADALRSEAEHALAAAVLDGHAYEVAR